ncbi:conserved protein of unknown function [Candidatus Promineifilum breve]|uniref:DinB-like domain-containing protein n=1 Tax=Candidatus Promineifilum breve TaxID=1806508 RepID=A0A160T5G9_9CHLR|nr:hypothetical protein [Candidatus Promineifilum breve]CUS04729.2 conserved protein of unknown function [Candidatus Promineifilum breve]
MTVTIPQERFTYTLFGLLSETFESVHGIYLDRGTSLFETLDGISAGQASRASSGRCATLAAQVNHVRFYLDILEGYMLEAPQKDVDWQSSWQVGAVSAEEWESLKMSLRESYARVRRTMEGFDSWDSDHRVGGAVAIVVHTAHHLGEIRQMLCVLGDE